jgi:hypothetical protein
LIYLCRTSRFDFGRLEPSSNQTSGDMPAAAFDHCDHLRLRHGLVYLWPVRHD